jgi:tRNA (guanine-N7-)-methyltransferase
LISLYFAAMGQKKLVRFAELKTFHNVFEYPDHMRGEWSSFFRNEAPIVLELACGKGEYAVGLAQIDPSKNYIGVDVKGNRIWVGARKAIRDGISNVAFIRTQIDKLANYFNAGDIAEIWITFPDPQLRHSKLRKRLTHPKFLRLYKSILRSDGSIHLKTDSPDLYAFTKEVIAMYQLPLFDDRSDLYADTDLNEALKIRTHYESLDISGSNRIHYLRFGVSGDLPESQDILLKQVSR